MISSEREGMERPGGLLSHPGKDTTGRLVRELS
jgi:hypothetical protein